MSLDNFYVYGVLNVGCVEGEIEEELDVEGKYAYTDVGVVIVMTFALFCGEKFGMGGFRGLFIGDIELDVLDDGMIVMLGEVVWVWVSGLSAELRSLIKVFTYTMRFMGECVWFGRMVFLEFLFVYFEGEMIFGVWYVGVIEVVMELNDRAENERWVVVACSSSAVDEFGLVMLCRCILFDDNMCLVGKIYCWFMCVDVFVVCVDMSSVSYAVCIDIAIGNSWVNAAGNYCGMCVV